MAGRPVPKELWPYDTPAPRLETVLGQIAGFLGGLGYTKTLAALEKDAVKKGLEKPTTEPGEIPLMSVYATTSAKTSDVSDTSSSDSDTDSDSDDESERDAVEGVLVDVEASETSDDGSSDSSSDSDSDSSSDTSAKAGQKRKRVLTPPSSDSGSSSSDADSDSDISMNKSSSVSDSGSDSDSSNNSSDDDDDARPAKRAKIGPVSSPSSSSDGDSSSSSSSSSDSSSDSSSSGSESEAEPAAKPEKTKKTQKTKALKTAQVQVPTHEHINDGSLSSATLEGDFAADTPAHDEENNSAIHPDRLKQMPASVQKRSAKKEDAGSSKKPQVPFSRIPTDQYVDPRFASNAYVSYDYADKAHQDLVVTKGKGFTKEKNKKKRGAYRGGAIDITPKGIKFED